MTTTSVDPARPDPTPRPPGGRWPLALLTLALFFKLVAALTAAGHDPLLADLSSDARYYVDRAAGIAGVRDDPLADEPHHLPPLYPHLLARLPGVVDGDPLWALVLQALAGTAALLLTWRLACRRLSPTAALVAPALMLLYAPLTYFETRLLGDSLATALIVAWLWSADRLDDASGSRAGLGWAAALGLGTGLIALLRPQALLLAPLAAAWLLLRRRGGGPGRVPALAAFGGVLVLTLLPTTLHNASASGGDLIPVSDNGGVNFWLANTGPVSGTFRTFRHDFADIAGQARAARAVAEAAAGRALSPGEVSSRMFALGLEQVAAEPGEFLRRVGWRALALLEDFETGVVCVPEVHMSLVPPLAAAPLPFGVLLALFAAALVLGGGRPATRASCVPPISVAAMVVVTTLLFFHYSRFRLPLIPLMALGVAGGVDALRRARPTAGRGLLALLVGAGALALSHVPAPHHDDARANGWTQLGESHLRLGLAARDETGLEAALEAAEQALTVRPGYVKAELLVVRAAIPLGRFDLAAARLDRIERHLPGDLPTRVERAWLLALPHPDNPHHDPEAARALLAELRGATADPGLHRRLDAIARALPPAGGG